ncbi:MAG TPA: universal stress protein [Chitinophagaceae bacterium]|nr:universal stress protein [Chitinophagaceae bacterium]
MKRILVTTDLSSNSRAGLRFAINLAGQKKTELVFLFVHQLLRASNWSDAKYEYFVSEDNKNVMKELTDFVEGTYEQMKIKPGKYKCAIHHQFATVDGIISYAQDNECDYICIATRGAGTVKKLFGTNTAALIKKSPIPVLCIPSGYKAAKPVSKLLYASDMTNHEKELEQVLAFAKPLKATVELLHMSFPYEMAMDNQAAEKSLKQKFRYDIAIHYKERDFDKTLMVDLERAVEKAKPSVVAMFTKQDRSLFDRIFLGSAAAQYSFSTNVPLLIFKKG